MAYQSLFSLAILLHGASAITGKGASKLPTLGWNSWNAYHCDIDQDKILSAANTMVSSGLQAAGYGYVNIDDCWSVKSGRNATGHIVPDPTKFPDGIIGVAQQVHSMGFKLGIYSDAGTNTCGGYPASLGYEEIDAKDFSDWGVDYLKYDNCNVPSNWTDEYVACDPDYVQTTSNGTCNMQLDPNLAPPGYNWSTSNSAIRYNRMRDALAAQDNPISLSMCIWGTADVFSWGNETGVSWRMSNDIQADWADITRILNEQSFRLNSTGFYGHNDMDMLEVGNGISDAEARSHFAFWAANKSPLLIGTDISQLSNESLAILKNEHLLAFNQDPVYGGPAMPYKWGTNPDYTFNNSYPAEYWSGQSSAGHLILMLNNDNDTSNRTVDWSEIPGLGESAYQVTDVWSGDDLGCLNNYTTSLVSHDTAAILVGDACC